MDSQNEIFLVEFPQKPKIENAKEIAESLARDIIKILEERVKSGKASYEAQSVLEDMKKLK